MRTEIKNRLLLAFSAFCLIGFAGQTYLLWQTSDRLAQARPDQQEIPESIERRLLAALDEKEAARATRLSRSYGSPFAGSMPLQDYFDSFFTGFSMPSLSQGGGFPSSAFSSMPFSSAAPEIAVDETENNYRILIPVKPDQELELNTNIEDNWVSVSGRITQKTQQSQNRFSATSISQRQFAKSLDLPTAVDEFGMTTKQTEEGIEITLPKKTT